MKEAIERYRLRREKSLREIQRIKENHRRWLSKKKRELKKAIEKLERAKPPKNVDETLLKLVEADRRAYVSAFKRALESIRDVEDLGKRLPELGKVHIDYGKHVIILFEREIREVNSILREMDNGYREYLREVKGRYLPEVRVEEKIGELKKADEKLSSLNSERESLLEEISLKRKEIERERQKPEVERIEEKIECLTLRKRRLEMEVRSNVSKIQKPLKRLRMGGLADQLARDSGIAIENPDEVVSLLQTLKPKLEGKALKSAEWLIKNLKSSVIEIKKLEKEIGELKAEKDLMLARVKHFEDEISSLERRVAELERERKRLEKLKTRLEDELRKEVEKLENVLGEKIEWDNL